jgi:uncharacterized protein YbjT (DUF2867 family)
MQKTIAVFGATGAQGGPVVTEALAKGLTVRAVGRDADRIKEMHPNVEAFIAMLDDEDAIVAALTGVDAAFLHLPMPQNPEDPHTWLTAFITAAHKASLPLLVYTTSGPAGDRYASSVVIDGGTGGMHAVLNSGISAIVLQPAVYLENLLPEVFLPKLRTEGVLDYPPLPPATKVQWTSHIDQARIAVAALNRPDLAGNSYEIGSPDALTGAELAKLVAKWIDRPVEFAPLSPAEFGQRVGDAFNSPGTAFALGDLYGSLAKLNGAEMAVDTAVLEDTFGVKLTTVAEHLTNWSKA